MDIDKQFTIGKLKEVQLTEKTECYGYFIGSICKMNLLSDRATYLGCSSCHKKSSHKLQCSCTDAKETIF